MLLSIMEAKFKKLSQDAILPEKATTLSIGYDLYVPTDFIVDKRRQIIPLGLSIQLPENIEAKIESRSGFSAKGIAGHRVLYGWEGKKTYVELYSEYFDADVKTGKIDPDYRGEIGVIIHNHRPDIPFLIKKGTRIAQMTFYPICEMEITEVKELSETERGDGGFGHSGD